MPDDRIDQIFIFAIILVINCFALDITGHWMPMLAIVTQGVGHFLSMTYIQSDQDWMILPSAVAAFVSFALTVSSIVMILS